MVKAAVCDDEWTFCEEIIRLLKRNFGDTIDYIEDFSCGEELIKSIEDGNNYQLIFLDQQMKELNGISTANEIRKHGAHGDAIIFFITAFECELISAINVHPFAYIYKPLKEQEFVDAVSKALEHVETRKKFLSIKRKDGDIMLDPMKIYYVQAKGHKCIIRYDGEDLIANMSLSNLKKMLEENSKLFVQVHRSYIINFKYFEGIVGKTDILKMKGNVKIPLGKNYIGDFMNKYREVEL